MAEIKEISVTTIKAAAVNDNNNNIQIEARRIELTPWDLQPLLIGPIQKGILFQKPPNFQENNDNIITCLKNSLSLTLDIFTPLAGRLANTTYEDGTVSYYIDCNNAGALFVHAVANNVTISDILEPIYIPTKIVSSFFPLNGVQNNEGVSKPLLGVQVTELIDGIFIGCTLNHVVGDGASFWHFFNTWSQINTRGSDSLTHVTKPPEFKRCFLEGVVEVPIRFSLPQALPVTKKLLQNGNNDETLMQPPPLMERVFHFTKENIAKLKAKANAEMGTNNKISSLQALLAHFWQSVVRNQTTIGSNQDVHYRLLIGARQRLQPKMSEQYFGNAVQVGSVTMKAGELLEHGIGYVAMHMNKVVAMYNTEEKFTEYLESWKENPNIFAVGDLAKNAVIVSSSPRFDVYGNDFGWGKPIAVRSGPGNKNKGKITLFTGVEKGSVEIEVCFPSDILEGMGNDLEFMDAVGYK